MEEYDLEGISFSRESQNFSSSFGNSEAFNSSELSLKHMGKSMGRQNPKIHLEGGRVYTILNALHHNHWSNVKKMLPHKKLGCSSRHNAVFGDPGTDKAAADIGEVQEHIDAETSKFLTEENATELITGKKEKAADHSSVSKSSMKSRIKALIAEEKFKRKGRHRRSSSCPPHTQLEKTNASPPSEFTELDAELALKGKSREFIDYRYSSGARISDPILPKPTEEPLTKIKTCELCAAINSATYCKQSEADAKELGQGASVPQASNQFMDALDIFGTRKEFFLKILLDPGSPLVHYLHNRQAFNSKTGLTKSVSFPVDGSAGRRAFEFSNYVCNQGPTSYAKAEDKFQVCNHSHDSAKFKSNINTGDQSVASLVEGRVDGISIPTLRRPKSFNNLPPCTPRGLKTEHENKPVIKHFKKLRQKISHAIRESRKEKQQQIIMDPVFHKIPYDRKYSKIMMEDTDDLQESVIEKCSKYSPLSSYGNDQSASACGKQIDIDKQCFRRTTSYNDSFDRYCRLFESSFNNEAKHQFSERLKLRAEQTPPLCESSKKSLGRLLSLPDLRSYFTQQNEDSPGPSGPPVRTFVDRSSSSVSTRCNEQKIPALSVDQESQKLLNARAESGGLENLVEYRETPSDSDNLTTGESTSHRQHKLEPTARPANLEPSSYDVVNSNSKEDTASPTKLSITEADSLASQQHEKGIDSLTVADSTANTRRIETPAKQCYGDFLVDIKDITEFNYVKDILQLSGFSGKEFLGTWHSIGQPIDPSMFEEVEGCLLTKTGSSENEKVHSCNHLLMFDLINEVLLDIHARSFAYFPMPLTCRSHISPMPVGYHVLEEVWADISWYLSWRPESYQSLDDAVSRDLDKGDGWMNLQFDAECVGLEVEDMIFEDLLDEMIFDDLLEELFWTKMRKDEHKNIPRVVQYVQLVKEEIQNFR